jgi:mannosyltransferase OCH1-like enzyme
MPYPHKSHPVLTIVALSVFLGLSLVALIVTSIIASANVKTKLQTRSEHLVLSPMKMSGTVTPFTPTLHTQDERFPRIFIQSYTKQSLSEGIVENAKANLSLNPGWTHLYFDDIDSHLFMHRMFPGDVAHAYDLLIPGAFKCDLFRLAALYVFGGVYADIFMKLHVSFDEMEKFLLPPEADLVVVRDIEQPGMHQQLYNAFIMVKPRHPKILQVLYACTGRVLSLTMLDGTLGITGPRAFGKELNVACGRAAMEEFEPHQVVPGTNVYVLDHIPGKVMGRMNGRSPSLLIETKYPNCTRDRGDYTHYSAHYANGNVYFPYQHPITPSPPSTGVPCLKNTSIPARLVQTWESRCLTASMKTSMHTWMNMCRKDTIFHTLVTSPDRRELVAEFSRDDPLQRTLRAYDCIVAGAFRADLWRLCHLYIHGGIYADIDTCPSMAPTEMLSIAPGKVRLVVVMDIEEVQTTLTNNLMMVEKNHPFIAGAIAHATANINAKLNPAWSLEICGPASLTRAFDAYFGDGFGRKGNKAGAEFVPGWYPRHGMMIVRMSRENDHYYDWEGRDWGIAKVEDYNRERSVVPNSNFSESVDSKHVYRSDKITRLIDELVPILPEMNVD